MKLTAEDKALLLSFGYTESDFDQIEEALKKSKTTYEMNSKRITREIALAKLGRKDFLSGVARSAFHYTAARETADAQFIYFDSSNLFK